MHIEDCLQAWLAYASDNVEPLQRDSYLTQFASDYSAVLRAAEDQVGAISRRLTALGEAILTDRNIPNQELLSRYIDAMSIDHEGERVFLPSFSDNCLQALVGLTTYGAQRQLSPFRGL